jgi:hypothetical protein
MAEFGECASQNTASSQTAPMWQKSILPLNYAGPFRTASRIYEFWSFGVTLGTGHGYELTIICP